MIFNKHIHEVEAHHFVCDASDLYDAVPAIRSGWPAEMATIVGNGMPFQRTSIVRDAESDVTYVEYYQANSGVILKVYND